MPFTTNIVIGLEIHVQLNTRTKLFCSCSTRPLSQEKAWVKEYLEKKGVQFEYVEHRPVTKPVDSAAVRGVELKQIAKALVYIYDEKMPVLLILSGDKKVDEKKLGECLNAGFLRMATPEEVKEHTSCVVGLVPPTIEKIRKIIDVDLLKSEIVSFNAGIATGGIKIHKDDLVKVLDNYSIHDISKKEIIRRDADASTSQELSKLPAAEPNILTCPTCLGLPGSKPVLNRKAVEYAIKLCMALGCELSPKLIFSRKSYFYPDLAKNYQITQYEIPLGLKGKLRLGDGKTVGITRVHMEEDPASLVHPAGMGSAAYVLVDYNRSGIPLCEIVTEPDMDSPEQAREFMKRLMTVLGYLDIFDEKSCVIKADANVSIKESGYVRSEIKNITGFREIERALFYEVERQKIAVRSGEKFIQDTRGWDAAKGTTFRMRAKEKEEDYGYILDTDLVVTEITPAWIAGVREHMPELAEDKIRKYIEKHKLAQLDAEVIAQERRLAEMFERVAKEVDPVLAAKWMRRELVRVMNFNKQTFDDLLLDEKHLIELLSMVEKKEITDQVAQKLLEELVLKPFSPRQYVEKHGLKRVADTGSLQKVCEEVIAENKHVVQEYLAGKEKSFQFLVGQVMRKTKGTASPQEVNELLKSLLKNVIPS